MTNHAQILNDIVVNVIVADSNFVAQSNLDYVLLSRGGIGWSYDGANFVAPQPYASWTLDAHNDWQPPTPKPDGDYYWQEDTQEWIAHDQKTD